MKGLLGGSEGSLQDVLGSRLMQVKRRDPVDPSPAHGRRLELKTVDRVTAVGRDMAIVGLSRPVWFWCSWCFRVVVALAQQARQCTNFLTGVPRHVHLA